MVTHVKPTVARRRSARVPGRSVVVAHALMALPTLGSIAVGLLSVTVVVSLVGEAPGDALRALLDGSVGSPEATARTLMTASQMSLVALAWIVVTRANLISIGYQGQMLAGGAAVTAVGLAAGDLAQPISLVMLTCAGMAAGALWAGIAGWMWARHQVNEIISTLLLNFIALAVVDWLVNGPLQESTHQFSASGRLPSSSLWPTIPGAPAALTVDVLIAPVACLAVWYLLVRTRSGFAIRLTGNNPRAALHSGFRPVRYGLFALTVSGCLAGLAGASIIMGSHTGLMTPGFDGGYGFTGIAVALIARNKPLLVLPAAVLMAALIVGGGLMESRTGVPAAVVAIAQGALVVSIAGGVLLQARVNRAAESRLASAGRRLPEGSSKDGAT